MLATYYHYPQGIEELSEQYQLKADWPLFFTSTANSGREASLERTPIRLSIVTGMLQLN
jgi:hypothetical protein